MKSLLNRLDALQGRGGFDAGSLNWLWLTIFVLDVLVIVFIVQSRKRFLVKVLWILLVIFAPIVGLILYFLLGREKS